METKHKHRPHAVSIDYPHSFLHENPGGRGSGMQKRGVRDFEERQILQQFQSRNLHKYELTSFLVNKNYDFCEGPCKCHLCLFYLQNLITSLLVISYLYLIAVYTSFVCHVSFFCFLCSVPWDISLLSRGTCLCESFSLPFFSLVAQLHIYSFTVK